MAKWYFDKEKEKYHVKATDGESQHGTAENIVVTKTNGDTQVVDIFRWSKAFYDKFEGEEVRYGYLPDKPNSPSNNRSSYSGSVKTIEDAIDAANAILAFAETLKNTNAEVKQVNTESAYSRYATDEEEPF